MLKGGELNIYMFHTVEQAPTNINLLNQLVRKCKKCHEGKR